MNLDFVTSAFGDSFYSEDRGELLLEPELLFVEAMLEFLWLNFFDNDLELFSTIWEIFE